MGKIAFIYPGQGTQKTGMGMDFYEKGNFAKEVYEEASQAIGLDIRKLCLEGQELLKKTEYTQAALLTTMLAMTREIESRGIRPEVTAGLSLGEYAAITEGRGLTTTDAVRLVRERGLLMEKAVPAGEGAMCAVLGLEETRLEAALSSVEGVTVANYNCPGQIVITGKRKAVEEAAEVLKKAGARRTLFLEVSGPFHSPYMEEAGRRLEQKLREIPIQDLQVPYISNVTAKKVTKKEEIRPLLIRQISHPVLWMQSMKTLQAEAVEAVIEIGPGNTLAGFLKKMKTEIPVYNIATWEDMETITEKIGQRRQEA
ncbi:ACP S-malonyltransferase [Suipraeoptans intestinalis]|uniref:ACP S-malonyltransferase n=1 Tax=Suipraeoptans intestinalis TaxID=2606628 RepID=UPI0023F0E82C|nr:ACP S-malonyltransferase [Suipraeoptans intestinalis]MDD7771098.1 ACP S-malonyltransferase [Suipraeoptans intestinalis]MDY3121578.1 ACP S-malonyltransferase [Suipraeoptans intestinalis]